MPEQNPIIGNIISGVVVGAILGVAGFFLGKAFTPDIPPVAVISPDRVTTDAGVYVEYSAAASSSPNGAITTYSWKIGGHPADQSSVGRCDGAPDSPIAKCRFGLPGTFSVSVEITDETGQSATAVSPVDVAVRGGFVGVVLFQGNDLELIDQAYRVILAAIDWPTVQQNVSRPILIMDPDRQTPVYANSLKFEEGAVGDLDTSVFEGARIMIPPFPEPVQSLIADTLEALGSVVVVLPLSEIEVGLERGLAGSGLLLFDSPADYASTLSN